MSAFSCYKSNCGGTTNTEEQQNCKCGALNACFSGCNNAYINCPPMMADGRIWASWQPEAVINNRIQIEQNINNNWNYREFLQKNGLKIMNFNTIENCYLMGMDYKKDTRKNIEYSKNTPFLYTNVFDTRKPAVGYCNSDLKNPYLSREQLNARVIAPYVVPPKPIV